MARADEFLSIAKARFKLAYEADTSQRERELDDLRAYDGKIWSEAQLKERGAQPAMGNLPPVAARPSLSLPLIQEPVRLILNSEREADLNIELVAGDDFGHGISL